MADTSNRPRPRPRPKPKAKASSHVKPSPATPGPSSSVAGPSSLQTAAVQNDNDFDAMFIKNRNRSLKTWHKLDELKKDDKIQDDIGSGSESEENVSPRSRKRVRKRSEALPKPKWQKDKEFLRILSQEPESSDDDADSDIIEVSGASTPNGRRREGKRKRQRSRSRSITPPPALPLQQIENVRKIIRQTLDEQHPQASISTNTLADVDPDDSTDTIIFDPELQKIAQQVRAQTPLQTHPMASSSRSSLPPVLDDEDEVEIGVKWKPHPLDPTGEEIDWQYKITRSDDFRELFEAIAEDASIRSENLIVCYDGKRIFASVTPQTLNIWKDAQFVAYEKTAFAYIRSHPELSRSSGLSNTQPQTQHPGVPTIDLSDSDDDAVGPFRPLQHSIQPQAPSRSQSNAQAAAGAESQSEADDDEEDNKFKLTLRSAVTGSKDIILTVRPTTKCGSIVKAFLKKAGLEAQYPHVFSGSWPAPAPAPVAKKGGRGKKAAPPPAKDPRLNVDGDKLDNNSPIGDADLEDGDLVEVVDL